MRHEAGGTTVVLSPRMLIMLTYFTYLLTLLTSLTLLTLLTLLTYLLIRTRTKRKAQLGL